MPNSSFKLLAETWLHQKRAEVSESTCRRYREKLTDFALHLGPKADGPLNAITKHDILAWRDLESDRISASTVNASLKILRIFFGAAHREGILIDNPAEAVARLKQSGKCARRPFTMDEIRRLLQVANAEWKSMILFGLYTGQRLGDIAQLRWHQVDLENKELRLTTSKTSRHQKIPLPPPLQSFIRSMDGTPQGGAPVHSSASAIVSGQKRVGTLSRQFRDLMVKAGLRPREKHRKGKDTHGKQGKRQESEISFHSLRHTTTSLLKNAGVSPAVAEEFVGHNSAEMNRHYTHIELDAMRKAAETLPDVIGMPLDNTAL